MAPNQRATGCSSREQRSSFVVLGEEGSIACTDNPTWMLQGDTARADARLFQVMRVREAVMIKQG